MKWVREINLLLLRHERLIKLLFIGTALFFLTYYPIKYHDTLSYAAGSDEQFYYLNTKSVVENNTLKASITFNGYGAKLFGGDAHGFAYPLIYGTIGRLLGYSKLSIPLVNLSLMTLAFVLVFLLLKKSSLINKALACAMMALYALTYFFTLSYHVESFYLLFSVITALLIIDLYSRPVTAWRLILFCLLMVLFSLVRVSWIIFTVALLPLAQSKKQTVLIGILVSLSMFVVYTYFHVFRESFSQSQVSVISIAKMLFSGKFDLAFKKTGLRGYAIFDALTHYNSIKSQGLWATPSILLNLVIISAPVYLIAVYRRNKDKLALGIALPMSLLLMSILFMTIPSHILRYSLPIFVLFLIYLVYRKKQLALMWLTIVCTIIIPGTFGMTDWYFAQKRQNQVYEYSRQMTDAEINKTSSVFTGSDPLVLIDQRSFKDIDFIQFLPVRNQWGHQIRYLIRLYRGDWNNTGVTHILSAADLKPWDIDLGHSYSLKKSYENQVFKIYAVSHQTVSTNKSPTIGGE